jgi:two-component system C4-dicarboxylate transport response regulator DctD
MPMPLQVKLLRVLEERQVERLGSNQSINIDVRIIAATKADLNEMSAAGTFRSDLYYRLNVLELDIPPLRERLDDVPLLFQHFALIAADVHGREINPLQPEQIAQLQQHRWPGNVRELRNLAERYVLMGGNALSIPCAGDLLSPSTQSLTDSVAAYERALIENALRLSGGSIKATMNYLDLPRKTLSDKMRKYDLDKSLYRD